MNRFTQKFEALKNTNSKALVTFITAGDPDLATTEEMILLLQEAGADIIELGMPFSDPMADGPTIQLSSERALSAGTNLCKILESVRRVRLKSEIPIVLMGYLNPIHAYGYENFARDAAAAGVDGLLIVDMPPEESDQLLSFANRYELNIIFLLTPTSDSDRINKVSEIGRGFVYYVTVAGVTGERQNVSASLAEELETIRKTIKTPIVAGFGISAPEQAARVASLADGAVVGSAIVKLFEKYQGEELKSEVKGFVSSLKKAMKQQ
jgi:tryptophan synthase alpha chain